MRWERNREVYKDASFAEYCARLDASHAKSYTDIRTEQNLKAKERYLKNKEMGVVVPAEPSQIKIRRAVKPVPASMDAKVSVKKVRVLTPQQKKMKRKRDHEYYCRKIAFRDGITQEEVHARIMAERKRARDRFRYVCKTAEREGISVEEVLARIKVKAKKHH